MVMVGDREYDLKGEGFWQGTEVHGIGEWIMRRMQIPRAEYEQVAKEFNPTEFNAKEWVRLARVRVY